MSAVRLFQPLDKADQTDRQQQQAADQAAVEQACKVGVVRMQRVLADAQQNGFIAIDAVPEPGGGENLFPGQMPDFQAIGKQIVSGEKTAELDHIEIDQDDITDAYDHQGCNQPDVLPHHFSCPQRSHQCEQRASALRQQYIAEQDEKDEQIKPASVSIRLEDEAVITDDGPQTVCGGAQNGMMELAAVLQSNLRERMAAVEVDDGKNRAAGCDPAEPLEQHAVIVTGYSHQVQHDAEKTGRVDQPEQELADVRSVGLRVPSDRQETVQPINQAENGQSGVQQLPDVASAQCQQKRRKDRDIKKDLVQVRTRKEKEPGQEQ
jgi:hypothetical protein